MGKFILENKKKNIRIESAEFVDLREQLSDLTETDTKVSDDKWEEIQLLEERSLPFSAGCYRLRIEPAAEL